MNVATWTNIGKSVEECKDVNAVLRTSKLDYEVEMRPVFMHDNDMDFVSVPKRFVTVRTCDDHPYDVVSDRFQVVQNRDAFDVVSYMGSELQFERAGETYNGMVYIIGKLPEVNILGDKFIPHVIFRNGFSGNVKISAAICPLRFVCQNQFNISFRHTKNSITIKHMRNAEQKLKEAKDVLKMSADYMTKLNDMANEYVGIKLAPHDLDRVLDNMFPIKGFDLPPHKIIQLEEQRNLFRAAYLSDDNSNFRGTGWGLVNAYTDFITHKPAIRQTKNMNDSQFMTVTFAPALMNAILQSMSAVGIGS